jgi:hypothetical protein
MVFRDPKKWASWLSMAEWWYKTTYHTDLKVSPFQALYGFAPPMINEVSIRVAKDFIEEKQQLLQRLKENLSQAQERMKKYTDKKRTKNILAEGDMVYLKLQP